MNAFISPSPITRQSNGRRIRICEEVNTCQEFDDDLSPAERSSLWYSQRDFSHMKSDCHVSVARCGLSRGNADSQIDRESACLRGLECLLAKGVVKQKRSAVSSIVQMSHQLQKKSTESGRQKEQDELLRQFSLTKTSYAQHKAYYLAARDAADAMAGGDATMHIKCTNKTSLQPAAVHVRRSTAITSNNRGVGRRSPSVNNDFFVSTVASTA